MVGRTGRLAALFSFRRRFVCFARARTIIDLTFYRTTNGRHVSRFSYYHVVRRARRTMSSYLLVKLNRLIKEMTGFVRRSQSKASYLSAYKREPREREKGLPNFEGSYKRTASPNNNSGGGRGGDAAAAVEPPQQGEREHTVPRRPPVLRNYQKTR